MFIPERMYDHLVKTFVSDDVEYKYYDITAIEPNYGAFCQLLAVAIIALIHQMSLGICHHCTRDHVTIPLSSLR